MCNAVWRADRNCFKMLRIIFSLPVYDNCILFEWRKKSFFGLQLCTRQSNYFHRGIVFVKDSDDVQYLIGCGLSGTRRRVIRLLYTLFRLYRRYVCQCCRASFYLPFDAHKTNILFANLVIRRVYRVFSWDCSYRILVWLTDASADITDGISSDQEAAKDEIDALNGRKIQTRLRHFVLFVCPI